MGHWLCVLSTVRENGTNTVSFFDSFGQPAALPIVAFMRRFGCTMYRSATDCVSFIQRSTNVSTNSSEGTNTRETRERADEERLRETRPTTHVDSELRNSYQHDSTKLISPPAYVCTIPTLPLRLGRNPQDGVHNHTPTQNDFDTPTHQNSTPPQHDHSAATQEREHIPTPPSTEAS